MDRKNKLLIIEDDKLNQLAYKGILSKFYDIKICGNVKEFDSAIIEDTYDLFVMDLALNCEKDGLDLIKELKQMEKYSKTPIIVVTAYAFQEDRKLSMEAGADKFIIKPFDNKTLLDEINNFFQITSQPQ
jgi:DNA-binding response OmpR family regulator